MSWYNGGMKSCRICNQDLFNPLKKGQLANNGLEVAAIRRNKKH